jgi:putative membrane protein
MGYVITGYFHYLGMALLLAALLLEAVLFQTRLDGRTARKLAAADAVYGLSALAVLVTGLLRVFVFAKPASYYGHNFLFHIKVTLFVVVFLLSIKPTVHFLRHRKADPDAVVELPGSLGALIKLELLLLAVIPLLAVMMGHGYGMTG